MQITRVFKRGKAKFVRLPADMAFEHSDTALEVERVGDEVRVRPVRRSLVGVLEKFARFSSDFVVEGRSKGEHAHRLVPRWIEGE